MSQAKFVDAFKQFLGADWFDSPNLPALSAPNPRRTELAQYLLTHSKPGPTLKPNEFIKEGAATEEPSLLNKLFGWLDSPRNTVVNAAEDVARESVDFFQNPSLKNALDVPQEFAKDLGAGLVDMSARASRIPGVVNISDLLPKSFKESAAKQVPNRYGSDLLRDYAGVDSSGPGDSFMRGFGGFALDIATDPLTYIPGGALFTGAKSGARVAKGAEEALTEAAAYGKRAENFIKPEAFSENIPGKAYTTYLNKPDVQVPPVAEMVMKGGTVPGRDMLPGLFPKVDNVLGDVEPRITDPNEIAYNILQDPASYAEMRQAKKSDDGWRAAQKRWGRDPDVEQAHLDNATSAGAWYETKKQQQLAKRGKVTDGKGNISQISVGRVIDSIERGDIPRWGPEPAQASGVARDIAVREADNAIDAILQKGTRSDFNPANQANLYDRMFKATERIFKSEPELVAKFAVVSAPKIDKPLKNIAKEIEYEVRQAGKYADNEATNIEDLISQVDEFAKAKRINPSERKILHKYFTDRKKVVNVNSPRALMARRVMARSMLRTAEDHLIRLGKQPQYWDGTRVRLSDVLEEIGLEANNELATNVLKAWQTKNMRHIKEPAVAEAINRALARRPLHMSSLLEDVGNRAKELKAQILATYNYPKAVEQFAKLENDAAEIAQRAGLTDTEIAAVKDLVRNVVDVDSMPHEKFLQMLGGRLHDAVIAGRIDVSALMKLNKEISKIIGYNKNDLMGKVTGNKYIDGFMLRFSTYWGRIDEMKRYSDDVFTWGEMNAVARATWLRNMVKMSGADQGAAFAALKVAQGMADAKTFPDPVVQKLAAQMKDYFDTMLESSGMSKLTQGNTAAVRSQIVMKDVNKHLKAVGSNFQFTDRAGVVDFLGNKHDFSATGEGWLQSWILANPQGAKTNPVSFMYDIDLAMERTLKEYTLIDEFGRNFGKVRGAADFDRKLHTAQLKSDRLPHDMFFTPQDRDMMQRLLYDLEDGLWRPNSKVIQHYSRGLRVWKTGVTIYTPSHHIRNLIGDLHLMWWAGHNDPRNFIRAIKIMHSQKSKYGEAMKMDTLDTLKGLFDKDAMEWAATRGGDVILKKNGTTLTADQIYIAAHQHGLLLDANKYEDIFGQAPLENIPGVGKLSPAMQKRIQEPLGGKAHHIAARTVAENREHYVRLAHFVGAINKRLKKGSKLEDVLREAAHEVRKWHPDGRDLTRFEQKTRLAIPFYSWTRKALPLVVQTAVTRPSKVLYYPRAQMALGNVMGIDQPSLEDPFPDNQLFPEWIRAKGIGPVFDPESDNPFSAFFGKFGRNSIGLDGQETGYVLANPSNPFNDVLESIGGFSGGPMDIARSIFDSSSPAIKIPGELAQDRSFSGAPISADKPGGQGISNYLLNQIPIVAMGANVGEWQPLQKTKKPQGREGGMDKQALINYLTALGLRGTGPFVKSAEFEASDRARMEKS